MANHSRRFINHRLTTATPDLDVDLPTGCASDRTEFETLHQLNSDGTSARRKAFLTQSAKIKLQFRGALFPWPIIPNGPDGTCSPVGLNFLLKTRRWTNTLTHLSTCINPEDGVSMYFRNLDSIANIHTVWQAKNRICIRKETGNKFFIQEPTHNITTTFNVFKIWPLESYETQR
jgi:hypothetical protein